jgi:hypothetical protein
MRGVRKPETCWAVNKLQDNKLEKLLHLVGDLFELLPKGNSYSLGQYIPKDSLFTTFPSNSQFLLN